LFLGGKGAGDPTAAILSIVQTCQHWGVDFNADLEHLLTALASGDVNVDELLPDRWPAANMGEFAVNRAGQRLASAILAKRWIQQHSSLKVRMKRSHRPFCSAVYGAMYSWVSP
jgi:hypothetical protein